MSAPAEEAEAEAEVETFKWVECSACGKWRRLLGVNAEELPDEWTCAMSADQQRHSCEAEEDTWEQGRVEQGRTG